MALWFVFALMTLAAVFAVLWPLGRRPSAAASRTGGESAIYLDQLNEIERDVAAGLLPADEADAARREVSRRLIAAADADRANATAPRLGLRRAVALAAIVGVPLISAAVYLRYGSPAMPDTPLADRRLAPSPTLSLDTLVAQVEARLAQKPDDGRGWDVLAPVLMRLARYDEAVRAWRNSIAYNGDSAARQASLGEALTAAANGVITAEARAAFDQALALDAGEPRARYFRGLAAQQDGRTDDARTMWRGLLAEAPADAPWRATVERALAAIGASADINAPALSDDTIAAAKDMTPQQRSDMARGMVERLAARLKDSGGDAPAWLRLVRAYMVLGERDKARAALTEARQALGGDADALRQVNDGAKDLGLDN